MSFFKISLGFRWEIPGMQPAELQVTRIWLSIV